MIKKRLGESQRIIGVFAAHRRAGAVGALIADHAQHIGPLRQHSVDLALARKLPEAAR